MLKKRLMTSDISRLQRRSKLGAQGKLGARMQSLLEKLAILALSLRIDQTLFRWAENVGPQNRRQMGKTALFPPRGATGF
jgi:hypothetical protein